MRNKRRSRERLAALDGDQGISACILTRDPLAWRQALAQKGRELLAQAGSARQHDEGARLRVSIEAPPAPLGNALELLAAICGDDLPRATLGGGKGARARGVAL
jgi:hypothetical protein